MFRFRTVFALLALSCIGESIVVGADQVPLKANEKKTPPDVTALTTASPERLALISQWLTEKPSGVGRPADDRAFWTGIAALPGASTCIANAEKLIDAVPQEYTDEDFLDFSKTGRRERGQKPVTARIGFVYSTVLAEALEDKGRFIPAIIRGIEAILSERTWVMPPHDLNLDNFYGRKIEVDLGAADRVYLLGLVDYWMGKRLPEELRARIRTEARQRVLEPYIDFARNGDQASTKPWWWITGNNNWNPACNAGVIGAGLCLLESRQERALLLITAENSLPHYFDGFNADGYCTEGLSYWNYGMGRYVMAAEYVRNATGGKLDFYNQPKLRAAALFPGGLEMNSGLYPAIADCNTGMRPVPWLRDMLERRLKLEHPYWLIREPNFRDIETIVLAAYVDRSGWTQNADPVLPRRSIFPDSEVFVLRPGVQTNRPFTVAFKGGHNAEHHNHNDLGAYTIGLGSATPILDPGGEVYTARTFSANRYDSQILSSYGHSVPLVAGHLQSDGRQFHASIVSQEYSDSVDRVVLDLSRGYAVPQLQRLTRSFVYSRVGEGELVVSDEFEFSSAQPFGTAVITTGSWKQTAEDKFVVSHKGGSVEVSVSSNGGPCTIWAAVVEGSLGSKETATRIGIDLAHSVEKGSIVLRIRPMLNPEACAEKLP